MSSEELGSIVIGFLDSAEGWAALDAGIAEATRRHARLVVVHSLVGSERTTEQEYGRSSQALDAVRERLVSHGIDHEVHEFVRGNSPSRDLALAADDAGAELIVIGIRRRSTTGKVLLGSNALEILHDADIPVLCVKP